MNIDIKNYEHYRVTSHGGRAYDLFNRKTDKVYNLSPQQYSYIANFNNPLVACQIVENFLERVG